ncbi:XAC0095 family protein [Lysobacter terrae]
MQEEHRSRPVAGRAYQLPEDGYEALLRSRDNLRLLANLATPRGEDFDESALTYHALTQCFHRLADELDAVVRAAWWPEQRMPADQ